MIYLHKHLRKTLFRTCRTGQAMIIHKKYVHFIFSKNAIIGKKKCSGQASALAYSYIGATFWPNDKFWIPQIVANSRASG